MEQVFDFREFMLLLLRKCRIPVILALVFGLLGGGFGFLTGGAEEYRSTAGVSVSIVASARDTAPLTDTMNSLNAILSDDYFYTSMVDFMREDMTPERFGALLEGKRNPTLSELKEVVKISVKGNLVLVTVQSGSSELTDAAADAGIRYAMSRIPQLNANVSVGEADLQTVNVSELEGGGRLNKALRFGILGLGGGIVLGVLWIFFFNVFDLKVRSADDLRKYGLPAADAGCSELAIGLSARVCGQENALAVLLTSSQPGVSTLAAADALFAALTALGQRAMRIDLTAGGIGSVRASDGAALPEALTGEVTLETARALAKAGRPREILLLAAPALPEGDTARLLAASAGKVLLVEQKKCSRTDRIEESLQSLRSLRAEALGFLLVD